MDGHTIGDIIVALFALLAAIISATTLKHTKMTHDIVNSRLDMFKKMWEDSTAKEIEAAVARGIIKGRQEQKDEYDKHSS